MRIRYKVKKHCLELRKVNLDLSWGLRGSIATALQLLFTNISSLYLFYYRTIWSPLGKDEFAFGSGSSVGFFFMLSQGVFILTVASGLLMKNLNLSWFLYSCLVSRPLLKALYKYNRIEYVWCVSYSDIIQCNITEPRLHQGRYLALARLLFPPFQ